MIIEIISRSSLTKVLDRAGIKLVTPGSAVRLTTDCTTGPTEKAKKKNCISNGNHLMWYPQMFFGENKYRLLTKQQQLSGLIIGLSFGP